MIFTKIMTWQDFLANKPAWNVLTWFATLVPMAAGLKNVGFLDWLAKSAGGSLVSLDPTMAVLGLLLAFCFASLLLCFRHCLCNSYGRLVCNSNSSNSWC